jgi:hypothetical protein
LPAPPRPEAPQPDVPPPHRTLTEHAKVKRQRTEESSRTAVKGNDWTCRVCGNVNWFRRGYCIAGRGQCLAPRNDSWLPGDWYCARGNRNLSRRTVFNRSKCGLSREEGEVPRF